MIGLGRGMLFAAALGIGAAGCLGDVKEKADAGVDYDAAPSVDGSGGDTTPPETTLSGAPDDPSASADASFEFSSSESGTFLCQLDGGGFEACTSPHTFTGLSDGEHLFQVKAVDDAGNEDATPAEHGWTVDTSAPDTSITDAPPAPLDNSTDVSFSFTSPDSTATFECDLDGSGFAACSSPHAITGLSDGAHTFSVRAVDAAGNTDPTPAEHSWTIDTSFPDTTIDDGPSGHVASTEATFSFSSATGTGFECQLDGGGYAACTSPHTLAGLSEDEHTFEVRATDGVNIDPTPASRTWTADVTPPDTSITSAPSGTVASTSATLEFSSADAGAVFECNVDGGGFSACASPLSLTGLGSGGHTFEVRARDLAGNVDPSPASAGWSVDVADPVVTITSGPVDPTRETDASFTFTVSDDSATTVSCQLDGGTPIAGCSSPRAFAGPLGQGSHTFTVTATDAAGNQSTDSYGWTVDTDPPDITLSGPADPTNATGASFTFTVTDDSATSVTCRLDGGSVISGCTSPHAESGLGQGGHTFTVTATDAAGNQASATHTWTIDTDPPVLTLTGPPDPTNATSATFGFTVTDDSATSVTCQLDGGSVISDCTSPVSESGPLAQGAHAFTITATDAAGNQSSRTHDWTIDTTPPNVRVTDGPADPDNDTTPTFSFDANGEAGISFECRIDGGAWAACSSAHTLATALTSDGDHTFGVRGTDAAGNTDTASWTWVLDTDPPLVTIDSGPDGITTGDPTASFTFSSDESGSGFACWFDSDVPMPCTSPETSSTLGSGSHTFSVTVTDAAGNTGNTATASWTIDLDPPDTVITAAPADPWPVSYATFEFGSTENGSSFECSTDGVNWNSCPSPYELTGLAYSTHTIYVRATDPYGNTDATPAEHTWTAEPGLVLYYPLNADAANYSPLGSDHDGTVTDASFVTGLMGMAARFNRRVPGQIAAADTVRPMSGETTYTVATWFRHRPSANSLNTLLDFRGLSGGCEVYSGVSGEGLTLCCSGDNGFAGCTSFDPGTQGDWHHLALMYDGTPGGDVTGEVNVYVDGSYSTSLGNPNGDVIFNANQARNMVMGDNSDFEIDEVRVYNQIFGFQDLCHNVIGGQWMGKFCYLPLPGMHFTLNGHALSTGTWGVDPSSSNVSYIKGIMGVAGLFGDTQDSQVIAYPRSHLQSATAHVISTWFLGSATTSGTLFDFLCTSPDNCAENTAGGGISVTQSRRSAILDICYQTSGGTSDCAQLPYTGDVWNHLMLRHVGGFDASGNRIGGDLEVFLDGRLTLVMSNPNQELIFAYPDFDFVIGQYSDFAVDDLRAYDLRMNDEWACTAAAGGIWLDGDCVMN